MSRFSLKDVCRGLAGEAFRRARVSLTLAVAMVAIVAIVASAAVLSALQAQAQSEWVVPERRAKRPNPVPTHAAAVTRGREAYRRECKSCHGLAGLGDGPKAAELDSKVPDITSAKVQEQTDGALFWKITEGRGDMPNTKTALSEEERWTLVHYLRSLAKEPSAGAEKGGRRNQEPI